VSDATATEPGEPAAGEPGVVVLGVVVAPGLARDVTEKVVADLAEDLRQLFDAVDWRTELVVDRLVEPPIPTTEVFDAARERLLREDWDLGIVVTDLPLRVGRRHVARLASPTHGIALVSLPALGPLHLRQRLRRTLVDLVGDLVGSENAADVTDKSRLLRELALEPDEPPGTPAFLFVPVVLAQRVRLLLGMVRANRPWRLAARLYRALVAALAVAAFSLVTSDVWRISAAAGWWRLGLLCAVTIVATTVVIIAAHGLWERVPDPRVREQVVLFNVVTALTVVIGIVTLYLVLFVVVLAGAELVLARSVLSHALGRQAVTSDYVALAWFVASLATVGGGLGAGLESHEAVREAAYAVAFEEQ
jgi:hypothetical protein